MGFTPLAGLVMGTRSGDVDPGLLVWLLDQDRVSKADLSAALEHESGLLGLAGIAAMAAAMGGADVIAFTGGVGENASAIRQEAMSQLGSLAAGMLALVVRAREDLEIARQVLALL